MSIDPRRALAVQRIVVLVLLLVFLLLLGGSVALIMVDTAAVYLPMLLAATAGVIGLGVLVTAFGQARMALAAPATPGAAHRALHRAGAARTLLAGGAIGTVTLGVTLALTLGDVTLALLAVLAAVGPTLAAVLADGARTRFLALAGR